MKIGDLVRCLWQPGGRFNVSTNCVENMEYHIENELGIITKDLGGSRRAVCFPQFSYTHRLATTALELLNENR